MTRTDLKNFFHNYPALSITQIGREAGYKEGKYLRKLLSGEAEQLPESFVNKIMPVLKKYGYGK